MLFFNAQVLPTGKPRPRGELLSEGQASVTVTLVHSIYRSWECA